MWNYNKSWFDYKIKNKESKYKLDDNLLSYISFEKYG